MFNLLFVDDDDFERLANNVRNLKRSMSVKKVTFEEEDFFQFETENNDRIRNNNENIAQDSTKRMINRRSRKNENAG